LCTKALIQKLECIGEYVLSPGDVFCKVYLILLTPRGDTSREDRVDSIL